MICFFIFSRNVYFASSVDPDHQTPRSASSDVGLDFLPLSISWDAGHKCVNCNDE